MLRAGRRAVLFGGGLVCALDWTIGRAWQRFVLPAGEPVDKFNLSFCAGIDVLVLHRPWADQAHVEGAMAALKVAGARLVVAVALPKGETPSARGPASWIRVA